MKKFKITESHVFCFSASKKVFFFPLIFCCLVISSFTGCASDRQVVNLQGKWKFALGDNMEYAKPGFDDSDWENVYVPSSWENEGFRFYNGYAWYRTTFELKDDEKGALYLALGAIDDVDEVYLNGHFIGGMGGFPPDYYTAYSVQRTYTLPEEYLNIGGENVIAVRVFDEDGEGGILGRNPGIYSRGDFSPTTFSLMGNWKFHLFDNAEWARPGYDDSEWENIVVPASWEDQGFKDYDGYAWYRKTFVLPDDFPVDDMVLLAGVIDDMDEVFLNGKRIGSTGNIDGMWARNDEWDKRRIYSIPDGLLKAGRENVVAVRVYDQQIRGGIYEGPVVIVPANGYKEFWRKYDNDRTYYGHGGYSTFQFGPFRFTFNN